MTKSELDVSKELDSVILGGCYVLLSLAVAVLLGLAVTVFVAPIFWYEGCTWPKYALIGLFVALGVTFTWLRSRRE